MKRPLDILVLSDVHLGTYGCNAKELLTYLESIDPKQVILNGDIIDIWHFNKRSWPKYHTKVVQHIIQWISEGKEVTYITGNHDETLRRFAGFSVNNFSIQNKIVLDLPDGKKAWIFHGDVFDVSMKHTRWIAKLGGTGYNLLIFLNKIINWFSLKISGKRVSFSKSIKDGVKSAVKKANNFEDTAAKIAADNGYDYVVCGHIHQPVIRQINSGVTPVTYLNSGDWIENLTALEYHQQEWKIFEFRKSKLDPDKINYRLDDLSSSMLFKKMMKEFEEDHLIHMN